MTFFEGSYAHNSKATSSRKGTVKATNHDDFVKVVNVNRDNGGSRRSRDF